MHSKKGFSLIEIIVSIMILSVVGLSVFMVQNYFSDNSDNLQKEFVLDDFGQYVFEIVEHIDINPTLDQVGVPFYIRMLSDNVYGYDNNPSLNTKDIGFPLENTKETLYHSIMLVGKETLQGIEYKHYLIEVRYYGHKKVFYITK